MINRFSVINSRQLYDKNWRELSKYSVGYLSISYVTNNGDSEVGFSWRLVIQKLMWERIARS